MVWLDAYGFYSTAFCDICSTFWNEGSAQNDSKMFFEPNMGIANSYDEWQNGETICETKNVKRPSDTGCKYLQCMFIIHMNSTTYNAIPI